MSTPFMLPLKAKRYPDNLPYPPTASAICLHSLSFFLPELFSNRSLRMDLPRFPPLVAISSSFLPFPHETCRPPLLSFLFLASSFSFPPSLSRPSARRRFRRHFCLADLLFSRPCAVAMERRLPLPFSPPSHVSPSVAVLVLPAIERASEQTPCFPSET